MLLSLYDEMLYLDSPPGAVLILKGEVKECNPKISFSEIVLLRRWIIPKNTGTISQSRYEALNPTEKFEEFKGHGWKTPRFSNSDFKILENFTFLKFF